jgi:hypothetical protein
MMKLFEFYIDVRGGESAYGYTHFVVAEELHEAQRYAEDYMSDFWGEGSTEKETGGNWYWDDWGTRCARVDVVTETSGTTCAGVDGKMYRINYEFKEVGL